MRFLVSAKRMPFSTLISVGNGAPCTAYKKGNEHRWRQKTVGTIDTVHGKPTNSTNSEEEYNTSTRKGVAGQMGAERFT